MIEGIMKELMEAETAEEILAHKIQLLELYNEVYDKIRSNLSISRVRIPDRAYLCHWEIVSAGCRFDSGRHQL